METRPGDMKRLKSFQLSSSVGAMDIISTLPDDCLLSIFSFLDRNGLDTMQGVSQRMNGITHQRGCRQTKRSKCRLSVESAQEGCFAILSRPDSSYCLVFRMRWITDEIKKRFMHKSAIPIRTHDQRCRSFPVPDCFFEVVKEVASGHDLDTLQLINFKFNCSFANRLSSSFSGKMADKFSVVRVQIQTEVNISDFLLKSNMYKLQATDCINQQGIFDENFVRSFGQNSMAPPSLEVSPCTSLWGAMWIISRPHLHVLSRYTRLSLNTLTLTLDTLKELIAMVLDQDERLFTWSVSVSAPLGDTDLEEFRGRLVEKSEVFKSIEINKRNSNFVLKVNTCADRYGAQPLSISSSWEE